MFLEFRLKFLSFFRKINETSGNGRRSKFSSSPYPGVLLIFEIFQNVPQVEKVAEHSSRVPPLAKTSIAPSCKAQMAGCLRKLVSGQLERYGGIHGRKASFKTVYIKQVVREQTKLQCSVVEQTKNQRVVSDVLAPAPALRPQVTSAAGHANKIFCAMRNGGDETEVICLVLLQDKSELNIIVNVDYCKLLTHVFS